MTNHKRQLRWQFHYDRYVERLNPAAMTIVEIDRAQRYADEQMRLEDERQQSIIAAPNSAPTTPKH